MKVLMRRKVGELVFLQVETDTGVHWHPAFSGALTEDLDAPSDDMLAAVCAAFLTVIVENVVSRVPDQKQLDIEKMIMEKFTATFSERHEHIEKLSVKNNL